MNESNSGTCAYMCRMCSRVQDRLRKSCGYENPTCHYTSLPLNIRSAIPSLALTMWLLILAGLLTISVGEETSFTKKTVSSEPNADDIVLLEIDVKDPVKRSPISSSAVYGASPSQFVIRHGDDAQELSPEYLAVLRQFTGTEPHAYARPNNAPQRRPLPAYAKQQQALQQAYYNYRKPAVVPFRPKPQLPLQVIQAEAVAQTQALQPTRGPSGASTYQVESYTSPKLGTFEQELLQLVSANQAQEFNLIPTQPKTGYSQQEYVKPTAIPAPQLPAQYQQYHIETSPPPRYPPQQVAATYQSIEQPVQIQYQTAQAADYSPKGIESFRQSPQYDYESDGVQLKTHPGQTQAEIEANSRAQAQAEAQALAFQKIAQASYQKHHETALEQIRIDHERYRQQSALEQIQQGEQVSEAGRAHIEGQLEPKDPEAAYRAKLKAQVAAEAAEARRVQAAAEQKAHSDAVRQVEAQQQAHVRAQEKAHIDALNFERNQLRAQAHAQALAEAQALALYKIYQQSRAKANNEILAAAKAQSEAKKVDPNGTPVVQYLLPNSPKLPTLNNYFTNDDVNKYQTSGSTYAPRSVTKPDDSSETTVQEQAYIQPVINQPRQVHKLKVPPTQSSVYVSQSGLLKKSPVKSLTIEEVIDQDQLSNPQVVRIPSSKDQQPLTQEELSVLINAGYTVTPIPQTTKPTQQSYVPENTSAVYYLKKQRTAVRPEYVTYEEVLPRPRRPTRKNTPILKQDDANASEKVTFLVPLEPSFGTRQPSLKSNE
ncbi:PREDICTED: mediator of RNA polymerase II transcription subunit 15-like [Cyphomyrmex costatus]|uniref:mediator of RNA polymerase II transcription subunit 15-like n=1 Tax=Cyphomyrmex costatus TaxID=456900 RepID=UPI00085243B8|nr:PREDICTED: mediator of RNA polymerase II transcription subunit 15-like [Cyphomyrmex costatus]